MKLKIWNEESLRKRINSLQAELSHLYEIKSKMEKREDKEKKSACKHGTPFRYDCWDCGFGDYYINGELQK